MRMNGASRDSGRLETVARGSPVDVPAKLRHDAGEGDRNLLNDREHLVAQ
jgi:hypothetical protein